MSATITPLPIRIPGAGRVISVTCVYRPSDPLSLLDVQTSADEASPDQHLSNMKHLYLRLSVWIRDYEEALDDDQGVTL